MAAIRGYYHEIYYLGQGLNSTVNPATAGGAGLAASAVATTAVGAPATAATGSGTASGAITTVVAGPVGASATGVAFNAIFPATPSYPVVTGTSSAASGFGVTSISTSFPSGVAAGDLLILFVARLNSLTTTDPSGWTRLNTDTTNNGTFEVWYRWYQAGDTAPTVTGGSSTAWVYRMLWITGASTSTAPEMTTLATATSTAPNPGALNPVNWDVEATLWIAATSSANNAGPSAYPTSYAANNLDVHAS